MVTLGNFLEFIKELSKIYDSNAQYLTELDSPIGDADHGLNINRGFKKVVEHLETTPPNSIDNLLKAVSMQLIKTVGGASGPLYGTFFLKASTALRGLESLDTSALCEFFKAGTEGVMKLGKAEVGDCTMIDTLFPAVQTMEENRNLSIKEMFAKAKDAAEAGMKSTIDPIAKKGRASYLGERSKGHQDPGATSIFMLIELAAKHFE